MIWSTLLLALTLTLVLPTRSLNMAQYRGIHLLLHESGTMIVLTCCTNPLLPALPLQLWVIALFQDTIQKVSNDAKQVVFLTVLWMVIMTLFQSQLWLLFIFGTASTLYFGWRSINSTTLYVQPLPTYFFGALNISLNLIVPLIFVSQSYAYYLHHQSYVYIHYPD